MITRNQTKIKTVLILAAVAMAALAIGQVQAGPIDVPNGDFDTLYKPGSTTITASLDGGEWFKANATNQGFNCALQANGIADYSDGTTGTAVDFPSWTFLEGSSDIMMGGGWGGPDGSVAISVFTGWGGTTQVTSAQPLNAPPGPLRRGSLSADVYHGGRPVYLDLTVDGGIVPPTTAISPPGVDGQWVVFSRTYDSIPAGELKILFGTIDDPGETGTRASIDNITLDIVSTGAIYPSPGVGDYVNTGTVDLSWTNADPNTPGCSVYVDVWFGTDPENMTKVVDAGENVTTAQVNAPTDGQTYYWQVNSYRDCSTTGDPDEGSLWNFIAVDDVPIQSVDAGVDMMTWDGEPVSLDATVDDDGVSPLTYAWTADPAAGVVFSPSAAVEDPTVTITKQVVWSPVTVPNPGFEERETFGPLADGVDNYNQWALEYWRHFETDNNGGPLRIWNPGTADDPDQGVLTEGFDGNAPEGKYVVLVRSRYNDNEYETVRPIRDWEAAVQLLDETFDPTTSYKLTAKVGRPQDRDYFGYSLQLAVGGTNIDGATYAGRVDGGTVIAEDPNSLTVDPNTFVTSTVIYTPNPANDHLAGLPLQVRLCALEKPTDHSLTGHVVFDDVQLFAYYPTYTLTLTVSDENPNDPTPVADTMMIIVYDDACQMARYGLGIIEPTDYDLNCVTDVKDLSTFLTKWLVDHALTAAIPIP